MTRKYTSKNERLKIVSARFSKAVRVGDEKELQEATTDLLATLTGTAHRLVSQAVEFLIWRQDKDRQHITALEERLLVQQRHIQMIDRLIEQQAREIEALLKERTEIAGGHGS